MSTPFNLQRDQLHTTLEITDRAIWGNTLARGRTINMNSEATVHTDVAKAFIIDKTRTNVAGNWSAIGVLMQQPTTDATPYRVKGFIGTPASVTEKWVVIGYAPASPVDGDNQLSKVVAFPVENGYFDEVILLSNTASGGDENLPIGIGVAFGESGGTDLCDGYISVQSLAKAPPQFGSSVS